MPPALCPRSPAALAAASGSRPADLRPGGTPAPPVDEVDAARVAAIDAVALTDEVARAGFISRRELIESFTSGGSRTWAKADMLGTLRLNLGRPDLAREIWQTAAAPRPSLRSARIGATWLIVGDFDRAREYYLKAIADEPQLFEALYGLATLEFDAGRPAEAIEFANRAARVAPGPFARSVCLDLRELAEPYVEKN